MPFINILDPEVTVEEIIKFRKENDCSLKEAKSELSKKRKLESFEILSGLLEPMAAPDLNTVTTVLQDVIELLKRDLK